MGSFLLFRNTHAYWAATRALASQKGKRIIRASTVLLKMCKLMLVVMGMTMTLSILNNNYFMVALAADGASDDDDDDGLRVCLLILSYLRW